MSAEGKYVVLNTNNPAAAASAVDAPAEAEHVTPVPLPEKPAVDSSKQSAWEKASAYKWWDPRLGFTLFTHPSRHILSQSARRRARMFAVVSIVFFVISCWSNILSYMNDESEGSVRGYHSALNVVALVCYLLSRTTHYQLGADVLTWGVWALCLAATIVDLSNYGDEYHLMTGFLHWLFVPVWMFLLVTFSTPMRAASLVFVDAVALFFLPLMTSTSYGSIVRLLLLHTMCDMAVLLSCLVHQRDLMQLAETEPENGHGDYESIALAFKHVWQAPTLGASSDVEMQGEVSLPPAHLSKPKSRIGKFFALLNVVLFHPDSHVTDRSQRRRARVLSGMTLFLLLAAGAWTTIFRHINVPQAQLTILYGWMGVCAALYVLSRTRLAHVAAVLAVIGVYIVPYCAVWTNADTLQAVVPLYLTHSTLTALMATMLCNGWEMVVIALFYIIPSFVAGLAPFPPTSVLALLLFASAILTVLDLRDIKQRTRNPAMASASHLQYSIEGKRDLLRERSLAWTLFSTVTLLLVTLSLIAMNAPMAKSYISATVLTTVPTSPSGALPNEVKWMLTVTPNSAINQGQQYVVSSPTQMLEFVNPLALSTQPETFYLVTSIDFTGPVDAITVSLVGSRASITAQFAQLDLQSAHDQQAYVHPSVNADSVPFMGASVESGLTQYSANPDSSSHRQQRVAPTDKCDNGRLHWSPIRFKAKSADLSEEEVNALFLKYMKWYEQTHPGEQKQWSEEDYANFRANLNDLCRHNERRRTTYWRAGNQWMHLNSHDFYNQRCGATTWDKEHNPHQNHRHNKKHHEDDEDTGDEEADAAPVQDSDGDNGNAVDDDSMSSLGPNGAAFTTLNRAAQLAPVSITPHPVPVTVDGPAQGRPQGPAHGHPGPVQGRRGTRMQPVMYRGPVMAEGPAPVEYNPVMAGAPVSTPPVQEGDDSVIANDVLPFRPRDGNDNDVAETVITRVSGPHSDPILGDPNGRFPIGASPDDVTEAKPPTKHRHGHHHGPTGKHQTKPKPHPRAHPRNHGNGNFNGAQPDVHKPRHHDQKHKPHHKHHDKPAPPSPPAPVLPRFPDVPDHNDNDAAIKRDETAYDGDDTNNGGSVVDPVLPPSHEQYDDEKHEDQDHLDDDTNTNTHTNTNNGDNNNNQDGDDSTPPPSPPTPPIEPTTPPTPPTDNNNGDNTPPTPTTPPTTPVSGGGGSSRPNTGNKRQPKPKPKPVSVADSIDWDAQNMVTAVRDQGACGCCWAFSSAAAVESALMIAGGWYPQWLAPQNIVDCVTPSTGYPQASACHGGLIQDGLKYAKSHGLALENDYNYVGQPQSCQSTAGDTLAKITSFWSGIETTEAAIINQLQSGPVALALSVDQGAWNSYAGGVLTTCGTSVNHGILVVGYGTDEDSGLDYFKIKNSWGPSWGESGFVRLLRNGNGFCGITSQAYRATA